MTIKVTTVQTVEEDVEVTLPAFRKRGHAHFKFFEDEKTIIRADTYIGQPGIETYSNNHMVKDRLSDMSYEPITEEEFDNAFNQAMNQLKQYQKEAV